ncbi:hypothetical protein B9G69_004375 [Bdellovibrio sp. SKB1291214]|uniref:hypothetical protein n=1 Tax=Bdellovibrio sp. SKB1291214 TaxID=1732569 RepID=UPI000B519E9A|nr:hypothetical protein [Bdellovibrio sp. SKB1291214]UYL09810.1 hypothetical protein B9G69_004375 [Bdellovibrio sp. SKB1291214]
MSINFAVLRRKLVIVLLFCVFGVPVSGAQGLGAAPGGFTSDGRRLAELNLEDLQSEVSLGAKADNRVLKNLLWSVRRNGTADDLNKFDSLYLQFKVASENGLSRIHHSIRSDYSAELLEELWRGTRQVLLSRPGTCAKVF